MRKLASRAALIAVILIIALSAYYAFDHVRQTIEVRPAKQAVLAIKADLGRMPLPADQHSAIPEDPPNIVVILADDMGWRDVGYNKSEIRTPVIDRLSSEGIRLNRFYVQPSCSPTRAALMTGRAPLRLGILGPLSKHNPTGLPLGETTLADHLKAAGYQTALTGKWHLGPRNPDYHPNARGFEHFYGHLTGGIGYYDKVHGGGYDWQRNGVTLREEGYTTKLVAAEAVKVIKDRDPDRPLFLYAAFGAPHLPNEAPEATVESYDHLRSKNRQVHAAMVEELDSAIGQIHAALESEGIKQDTLIWFMSDNGGLIPDKPARHLPEPFFTMAVEHLLGVESNPTFSNFVRTNLRNGGSDNRPFQGGKQSVAEGGVRVPAFVYWPGTLKAGDYNYMATVQDVLPTLLDVSGSDESGVEFDGRSLWTGLNTNTPATPMEYIVQTSFVGETAAVYRYPFKLVDDGGDTNALYNLEVDPLESQDIASSEPEIVADLSAYLAAFPRGPRVALPLQVIVDDPDYFGGEEDRDPWADQPYTGN